MIINPIYKKELLLSNKSVRYSVLISAVNMLLGIVAILYIFINTDYTMNTANIPYIAFLELFIGVSMIEYILFLFVVPAFVATSISSEREADTLFLILSTKIRAKDIVLGKLYATMVSMAIVLASSLPIKIMILSYGGVSIIDIICLTVIYIIAMFYISCIGIYMSSLCKTGGIAVVSTYAVLIILILSGLILFGYTYAFNPVAMFLAGVDRILEYQTFVNKLNLSVLDIDILHTAKGMYICMFTELVLGVGMLILAIRRLEKSI